MPQEWQAASKERHFDASGYLSNRTIAALCTPTGGAICVLRISGPEAFSLASSLVGKELSKADHRKSARAWLKDSSGKTLDDGVVLPFVGPNSFTGEDSVEFFLHGSPMIAQRVLDEIFRLGARMALPGEFSFRAVRNGKMTLSQAEAVKEVIAAENDFSLELALEKLSGSQHALIEKIRTDLLQLCTLSEVGIDFSDQDIDEVSLPRLKGRLTGIVSALQELRGSFDRGKRFREGVPVSIFGLPNAGKSSFFNALLGEDRSIVSNIAGTTRDVVRERLNLKGDHGYVTLKLSDTAGLRKSGDVIEEIGIERSIQAARDSDLVVVLIDGMSPELHEVQKYLATVGTANRSVLFVVSKKDVVERLELESLKDQIQSQFGAVAHFISSKTHEGIEETAHQLANLAEQRLGRKPGEVILTQFEHVQAVEKSLQSLRQAEEAFDLVLFATDVRHGMNDLGPLIGETIPDDVLGKIFSDFCIGK
jgi:tRNA modification GTPase